MSIQVLAEAVAAAQQRRPFVLCTVVWRRGPTSGQQGSKALVWADGTMEGFIGGACAQPTVVAEALASMQDGEPRLLFMGQAEERDSVSHDGARSIPMACDSEGALELYLEPHVPLPALVAVGGTPAVGALVDIARAIGWEARVVDSPDLGLPAPDQATAVVVATQGHYDDLALRAAVAGDAGYIGLIASRKRAHAVIELVRPELSAAELARIHAPAGLDLGRTGHREIAVSVMADLVARRACGELRGVAMPPAPVVALDPVCGMTVVVEGARHHHTVDGIDHVFCAAGCRAAFAADPAAFL